MGLLDTRVVAEGTLVDLLLLADNPDATCKLTLDVVRGRRARSAKAVGRGRSQRHAHRLNCL